MSTQKKTNKGVRTEETLRYYFLDLGYFVVRGVKFTYQDFDITDVDLWLYMRPSSLTRERVNVDIKNKRTPQAMERIFWAKGLQQTLGLEKTIVATTDKRSAVRDFGKLNNVSVLDGTFLSRLSRRPYEENRLTEEEFFDAMDPNGLAKLRGNWGDRITKAKSRLLTQLDYGGCNAWLQDIAYFAEQAITDIQRRESAYRIFYLMVSFFLIGLDYILKDISFLESEAKAQNLRDGFRHGASGKTGTNRVLSMAVLLLEGYLADGKRLAEVLKKNVESAYEQIPADILKEYFGRSAVSRDLFQNARKLEALAYARQFIEPQDIEVDLQAIIGALLDFSAIERRQFFTPSQRPEQS